MSARRPRRTGRPDDLPRLVAELAETNRRLLNREHELRRQRDMGETYNRIVTALIRHDLKAALAEAASILCAATGAGIGLIYVLAPDDGRLVPLASQGIVPPPQPIGPDEGLPGISLRERKTVVTGDVPDTFPFRIRHTDEMELSPRVLLAQPLAHGDQQLGTLLLGSLTNYAADALDLVRRVSVQLALAVAKALTLQRTLNLARELQFKSATLQRQYRELERAHRLKTAFLAGASHELKTPLNAIIGFSRVLLKGSAGSLADTQTEYLEVILRNGEHLLAVIDDILDLSRIESGAIELVRQPINLYDLIEGCIQTLAPLAGRRGQRFEHRPGSELPALSADPGKIRQIVYNILGNAVKFSPEGGVIGVTTRLSEFGDEIQVAVTDNGPGIPDGDRERVFEPFYRIPATADREGTGLGLPMARQLVELHGGRIWVEPNPVGVGSVFRFTLPVFEFLPQDRAGGLVRHRGWRLDG